MRKMINLISGERITLLSTNQDDDESGTSEFKMLSRTSLFPRIVILNWNNQMLAWKLIREKNNFMIKIM